MSFHSRTKEQQNINISLEDLRIDDDVLNTHSDNSFKKKRALIIIGACVLIAAIAAVSLFIPRTSGHEVSVRTVMIEEEKSGGVLTAGGNVVSKTTITVSSKIPGQIDSLTFDRGDLVKAGDIIATLDNKELKAGLYQEEANYNDATRNFERIGKLFNSGVLAKPEFDGAETRYKTAEGRMQALKAQLDNTIIRSPISGMIIRKHVEIKEMVFPGIKMDGTPGSAIATVADIKNMEVEADINETDIKLIHVGRPVTVTLDAYPRYTYNGVVKEIAPMAERQKSTIEVVVTLLNADQRVRPEMSAKLEFLSAPKKTNKRAMLIPATAVSRVNGKDIVYVVDQEDRIHLKEIKTGEASGENLEVVEGLDGHETIITKADKTLRQGDKVVIIQNN